MQTNRFTRGMSDYQLKMAFIMPTMILLILMNIFPLLWSLFLSFHRYKASMPTAPKYIGVRNYTRLLSDPEVWGYFRTTAYFVVLAVTAQFFIGFWSCSSSKSEIPWQRFCNNITPSSNDVVSSSSGSILAIYTGIR